MRDAFGVSKAYYPDHDPVVQAINSAQKHAAELGAMKQKAPAAKTIKVIPKGKAAALVGGGAAGGAILGGGAVALANKKKVNKSFADVATKVGTTIKPMKLGSFALKPLKSSPPKVAPLPTKAPGGTPAPAPNFVHYDQGKATQMTRQNMKNSFR